MKDLRCSIPPLPSLHSKMLEERAHRIRMSSSFRNKFSECEVVAAHIRVIIYAVANMARGCLFEDDESGINDDTSITILLLTLAHTYLYSAVFLPIHFLFLSCAVAYHLYVLPSHW